VAHGVHELDIRAAITFRQLCPWGRLGRQAVVLSMVLVLAMEQAPVATVSCHSVNKGGILNGSTGAQDQLRLVGTDVQIGREDKEEEVDGCMQQQGALEGTLDVVPAGDHGYVSECFASFGANHGDHGLSE